VVVLALLPAREQEAAVLERLVRMAVVVGDDGQRGGAVDLHREDVETAAELECRREGPPRGAELPAESADESEDAIGDRAHAVAVMSADQVATELDRPGPLPELT
jgi:hypothetical protein